MESSMGWLLLVCWHLLVFHFSSSHSLCHPHDSFALLHFNTSFTISTSGYYEDCPDTNPKTTTWKNGTDCCSWHGVTCHPISGHVIGLDLSCSGLQGKLHHNSTLFRLSHLQSLNLAFNDFSNSQLSSLFGGFVSLTHLNLCDSYFEGEIPSQISHLSKLQSLDLSANEFQGPIPPSFSNLTRLISLDLSENNLNGSIPSSLLTLPSLTILDLSDNHVSGQIPNVFHQSNKFEELSLSFNSIGGELPSTLSNLLHLTFLDLAGNNLEGPLPNKITGFSNLTMLMLQINLLNGTIPSWCLSLPSLVNLDLSGNQFTGHITAISSYSLERLYLCYNKLHGNIPESIFSLVNIVDLCLSSNNFSGPVNFSLFSKLRNLESLSLSWNNQLSLNFKSNANYSLPLPPLENLELSSINLTETEIPRILGKFSSLSYLDLSDNKLNGKVPNWLLEMDSLKFLNLSQNHLTSLMDNFSRNDKLGYIDLSFNLLTSGISSSICNASSIQILNLSHNKLTGTIPHCLVNLSSLQVLDLQMNKLCGTLPNTFSKHNRLTTLNLNHNQLEGLLPESLSNCTILEILNLGNNQIEDKFPHWLHRLTELKVLVLKANKFHGPITSLKTKPILPNLVIFDISDNNFNDSLPIVYIENFKAMKDSVGKERSLQYMQSSYGSDLVLMNSTVEYDFQYYESMVATMKGINMMFTRIPTIFTTIDLSRNKFEGEIPDVIGDLHALKGLNLSHNKLSGSIPQSMGNLANLESLDLSSNMLTGRIPTELANLNFLEVLDLSYNHFVGEIPHGKQFDTFSNDSYEGNLGLCGVPLSIKCSNDPEQHSPVPSQTFGFGWKPVAIGYGCGMVFGVGIGCCVLLIRKPQ